MENKKEILEELNEVSPLLFSLKESEPLIDVTEINFEKIQESILSSIKETEQDIIPIRRRSNYFIKGSIAASLFMAVLLIALNIRNNKNSREEFLTKNQVEIQKNIEENINELPAKEIGYFFAKQGGIENNNKEHLELSETEINQYIENNPVYISDLYSIEL